MRTLSFMLWLALLLPWQWWKDLIWRAYFQKRVFLVAVTPIRMERAAAVANQALDQAFERQDTIFITNATRLYGNDN